MLDISHFLYVIPNRSFFCMQLRRREVLWSPANRRFSRQKRTPCHEDKTFLLSCVELRVCAATIARQTYLRRLSAAAPLSAAKDPKRTPATEDVSPV